LLNTTDPRLLLVVPAEKFTGDGAAVPAENTSVLLEPLMVRFAPPEKCQRLPCRLEVVPDVFPVMSHAWAYFVVSPESAAVVRYAPTENTMLLLEPDTVIELPPENQRSVPAAELVVPAVLPVSFQFWTYLLLFADRSAVVR